MDFVTKQGVPKNSLVPSKVPPSLKDGNTSLAPHLHDRKSASLDGSTKLDPNLLPAQAAATVPARSDSSSKKPGDQTDQKTIRLRIKAPSVCSAQKNATIYSGRDSSVSYTTPVESLSNILQVRSSTAYHTSIYFVVISFNLICVCLYILWNSI